MRHPNIVCECGHVAKFRVGAEEHLRKEHGFITVYKSLGGKYLVPILSHPAHTKE